MRVVFVKEMPKKNVVKDIKKAAGADVVTDETNITTPELQRNEYGRPETK